MAKVFEHILVPYNGTSGSEKAFKKAISMASSTNSKITVLTCIEERQTFGFFKTKTSKQEYEKERKLVEKQHLILEKICKDKDIPFGSAITKNGLASERIVDYAKKHNIDLIITKRTKMTSSYEKHSYHSTVENMFRLAPCPILIL
ncbi:universal stress protein [Nitrosopumilus sp.]|uniref:universal stress protein n=1 Tax=Nitrosopumilus sp. TaxID=2024843 RepID=UPI00261FE517|nr:universal stress protein [Nitrosopumilus sp.]